MRVVITGGRDHTPTPAELARFDALWVALGARTLVHGTARGVDTLVAAHVASAHPSAVIEPHPARWNEHGRAAGFIRNTEMLRSDVAALIAFPGGRGTANCVAQAQRLGIPVHFVNSNVTTEE